MTITMDMFKTVGFAVILLLFGRFLRSRVKFFQTFAIPSPVIGGVLFSIINTILRVKGIMIFEFDDTLQKFFMVLFFTSIGFNASFAVLKKGGKKVVIFLLVAAGLCVLQNATALGLSGLVGWDPKLALMTGSTPMTGGHGTSAAIAPFIEEAGVQGAGTIAITSATYGLLAGSLLGGPIGNMLITKFNLFIRKLKNLETDATEYDEELLREEIVPLDKERVAMGLFLLLVAIGVGVYVTNAFNAGLSHITKLANFPIYIGPIMIGILLRNLSDGGRNFVPTKEIEVLGEAALNVFLAMALMSMKLWELASLAGPLVILLLAQTVLMVLYSVFVTFRVMGSDYDAAVISAGHVGFGMGATPNGVANMNSLCEKYTYSKMAFFVLPIVGGMFIDLVNVFIIIGFMTIA